MTVKEERTVELSSETPRTYRFTCAMTRPDLGDMNEEQREKVYAIAEFFQTCVKNVNLKTDNSGTKISIEVFNLGNAKTNSYLLNDVHYLVSPKSEAEIEIFNLNDAGKVINTEHYTINDVVISILRTYEDVNDRNDIQTIKITGTVVNEYVME